MSLRHLNQIELAARWNISHRTLERWRWSGEGPRYIKIGGRVVYRLEDVEDYEKEQIRASTTNRPAPKMAAGARWP
jgi:predicted site-specific integrase-resolvase